MKIFVLLLMLIVISDEAKSQVFQIITSHYKTIRCIRNLKLLFRDTWFIITAKADKENSHLL